MSRPSPARSPLCETVQWRGVIPETVPTRRVIDHSSQLKSDGVESGLSPPGAQASPNQPVNQVTACECTFEMRLWVVGWAGCKIMLVMVVGSVRLGLGDLPLGDIRAGNVGSVFILRLKLGSA